jgi:catechol 2,3-dioxygenase-like lactoylglutathione lyase family enzyme
MNHDIAEKMVDDFSRGQISRRQLVAQLVALGAAGALGGATLASQDGAAKAAQTEPMFQATGLDHLALSVTNIARSVEFYQKHLGLKVTSQGQGSAFLDIGDRGDFLALFRSQQPGMHHYCYGIRDYNADSAAEKLTAAGLEVRRAGGRIYFPDPDGLEVQVAAAVGS